MSINGRYKCSLICDRPEKGLYLRHNGIMKLYEDENQLKGSMFPTFFWLNSPFRGGQTDGRQFAFTVHFATPCQQFSLDIQGVVEGDRVSGTARNATGLYVLDGQRLPD